MPFFIFFLFFAQVVVVMACDDLSDQFRCMFPRCRIYEAEKNFPFMSSIIGVFLIHVFLQGFVGYPETVFLLFSVISLVKNWRCPEKNTFDFFLFYSVRFFPVSDSKILRYHQFCLLICWCWSREIEVLLFVFGSSFVGESIFLLLPRDLSCNLLFSFLSF